MEQCLARQVRRYGVMETEGSRRQTGALLL